MRAGVQMQKFSHSQWSRTLQDEKGFDEFKTREQHCQARDTALEMAGKNSLEEERLLAAARPGEGRKQGQPRE